jgi:hypothetical protein
MNPASAKTSVNQIPFLHKWIARYYAGRDKFVFDFGAGKHGKVDQFMIDQKIAYAPYDPFNRLPLVNEHSTQALKSGACDFVVCSNVLNVIEDEHLDHTISELLNATCLTKMRACYVTVYHKASLPKNRQVGNHFQRNEPLDWYKKKLEEKFDVVIKNGKVLTCLLAKG